MEDRIESKMTTDPVIMKWEAKYDNFGMPEYIQGTFIGENENLPLNNGEFIRIHDIEFLDIPNRVLKTSSGEKFYLAGQGNRIFVVANDRAFPQTNQVIDVDD